MHSNVSASPLLVRIPVTLKERLAERAATNHRSMTGEILQLLEAAIKAEDRERAA